MEKVIVREPVITGRGRLRVAKLMVARAARLLDFRWARPAQRVALGYLLYTLVGCVLLSLPFAQSDAGSGILDNLFIATSAMSTTGLTTVSIADSYSVFGQIVVLVLIQLGGIGYMTVSSFVVLSRRRELTSSRESVGKVVYSLPSNFDLRRFIRSVFWFTAGIELAGAIALWVAFERAGVETPLWSAVFHSISAFCTAGFSLYNTSFEAFYANTDINLIISILSIAGAVGFIVFADVWGVVRKQWPRVTLTTKVILWSTLWLIGVATLLLFFGEPSISRLPFRERTLAAFFQAMTASTTVGFNTVSIGALSHASLLVVVFLMIVGASPSGTGGGAKTTSLSAGLGVMRSAMRGGRDVTFFGHVVPRERVMGAFATLGFYGVALATGCYLLELSEPTAFEQNVFEAASALGTVGLSTGVTGGLTVAGKLIIIALMYVGRVGPLTMGAALFLKERPNEREGEHPAERRDDLAI